MRRFIWLALALAVLAVLTASVPALAEGNVTTYPLKIAGVEVTSENRIDILNNGLFSFDGNRTLTVKGSFTWTDNDIIENEGVDGLIIYVAKDSVLTGNSYSAIRCFCDTTVTGSCDLVLNTGITSSIDVFNGATLRIEDISLAINTGEGGIWAYMPSGNAKLILDNASVTINCSEIETAIFGFTGGITMIDCGVSIPAACRYDPSWGGIGTLEGEYLSRLSVARCETYPLTVAGVPVTELNKDDILDNGVFSFNGISTLTVHGDYHSASYPVIQNEKIEGLTIRVTQDSHLSASDWEILDCGRTTSITGSGALYMNPGRAPAVYARNGAGVQFVSARVTVNSEGFGLFGDRNSGDAWLFVSFSSVLIRAASQEEAVVGFTGGIDLRGSEIASPEDWVFNSVRGSVEHTCGESVQEVSFEIVGYVVSFDGNGGESNMDDDLIMADAPSYTLPDCQFLPPEGYLFIGWDCGQPGDVIELSESITVKALWGEIQTITFLPGDGTGTPFTCEAGLNGYLTVRERDEFTPPRGKSLAYWTYGDPGDPSRVYVGQKLLVTGNMTLTAQWKWNLWRDLQDLFRAGGKIALKGTYLGSMGNTSTEYSWLEVPAGVTVELDLRGFDIDRCLKSAESNGFVIKVYGTLIVTDSKGGGKITGGNNSGNGGGVYVLDGGVFSLKGGSVTGNYGDYYGGVYVANQSIFNMSGGSIANNTTQWHGGGVAVFRSVFHLSGGSITGNTAQKQGGGVFTNGGVFNMTGGTISGNQVLDNMNGISDGGGVYMQNNSTFNLMGGKISNNQADREGHGAGVYLSYSCVLNMSGGEISGNSFVNGCGRNGGGVYCDNFAQVNLTGGAITGNSIGGVWHHGAGVYVDGDLSVSGSPVVTSNYNTQVGQEENIFLPAKTISVTGELTSQANLGVTYYEGYSKPGTFTKGLSVKDMLGAFHADDPEYIVGVNGAGDGVIAERVTVTFASNGGSGMMDTVTLAKGSKYILPECGFIPPEGLVFNGWDQGSPGDEISLYDSVTLLAQWSYFSVQPKDAEARYVGAAVHTTWKVTFQADHFQVCFWKGGTMYQPTMNQSGLSGGTTGYADLTASRGFGSQEETLYQIWAYRADGTHEESNTFTIRNPIPYTVTYYVNIEGAAPAVAFTETVIRLRDAVKYTDAPDLNAFTAPNLDYVFRGWYADPECTASFNPCSITGNTAAYAGWTAAYRVTFDNNGVDAPENEDVLVLPGGKLETNWSKTCHTSEDPGHWYRFSYWSTDQAGNHPWDFDDPVNAAMTLYAQWVYEGVYTVTIHSNGYGEDLEDYVGYGQTWNPTLELSTEEYTHMGYYLEPECENEYDHTQIVTGDFEVYSKWQKNPSLIIEGSGLSMDDMPSVPYGLTPDLGGLPSFSMDGYAFGGLYEDEDATVPYTGDQPLYGDMTVYVKWEQTFTVSFRTFGGSAVESQQVVKNGYAVHPGTAAKAGSLFDGWYADAECTAAADFDAMAITGDTVFYAGWITPQPDGFLKLPAGTVRIKAKAFLKVSAEAAVIPKNVASIDGNPFDGSAVQYVYGYPGALAETFAEENGYVFVPIDDAWMAAQ